MSCLATGLGDPALCSGQGLQGQALFDYWCQNDCVSTFSTILNTKANGELGYNPNNLPAVQNYINNLFQTYQGTNQLTDDVNSPQYNPFQEQLLSLCTDPRVPGGCGAFLTAYCTFPRAEAAASPTKTNFCGCYVTPDPTYLQYTEKACKTVSCDAAACDPLCHRISTVQKADPATGVFKSCINNVCVIDNVSIDITRSRVGAVNFANICPACGDAKTGCVCIISGVDVSTTLGDIGVGTQFNQYCGADSICLQNNQPIPCSSVTPAQQSVPQFSGMPGVIFFIVVILIVVIAVVFFIAAKQGKKTVPA
jgi:hypothetical protein